MQRPQAGARCEVGDSKHQDPEAHSATSQVPEGARAAHWGRGVQCECGAWEWGWGIPHAHFQLLQ